MLQEGKLNAFMNENHTIQPAWLGRYNPEPVADGTYVVKDGVLYKLMPKATYFPGAAMYNVLTGETHYPTNYAMVTNLSRDMLARFLGETAAKWCDFEDKTEEETKHFREWLDEEVER